MRMITKTSALAKICASYAESPYITVDTEFLRERTYWSQLCLVQMARPGDDDETDAVLIDPLAQDIDLTPLYELMRNPDVIKVFHAARQDIEIFHHMGNVIPTPLFDTQVAAMVCGFGEQVGYETLVRKIARAQIDKSSRFTDWSRRPLSTKQRQYALADVTHLRGIYEHLSGRIEDTGRANWVSEEMAILTNPGTYDTDPSEAWRRVKTRNTSPIFLSILRSLADWRERTAQSRDVPRSRIMKDDALLEIAASRPKTIKDFSGLRLAQREARKPEATAEIIAAIEAGAAVPAAQRPKVPAPPKRKEGSTAVAEMLKVLLKARSEESGVAQKLIASSADIDALSSDELDGLPVMNGWRREVFGADALRICNGTAGLVARPGGVQLIDVPEA